MSEYSESFERGNSDVENSDPNINLPHLNTRYVLQLFDVLTIVEVTFHNQLFALGLLKPRWSFRPEVFVVCRTSIQKKETQTTSIAFDFLYVCKTSMNRPRSSCCKD